VAVEVGQLVGEGLECCVVEAMKMQNSMKASITGKVKAVLVKQGESIMIKFQMYPSLILPSR